MSQLSNKVGVSWNATKLEGGVQNSVADSSLYAFVRVFDKDGDSVRFAYSRGSNSLIVLRTVDGKDEILRTI